MSGGRLAEPYDASELARLTTLIGSGNYAWVGCTGQNDGNDNIVYTWDVRGGTCDSSLFASHAYTTTSSSSTFYVYAFGGELLTVQTAGVSLGVACEGNHPPPALPPYLPPTPPVPPPPSPPPPFSPPPPPMLPDAPDYAVCFPTEIPDTTGYTQYGDGTMYVHFADAAKVCWTAGSACGAIVRFQTYYLLRSTSGGQSSFAGVSLYMRGSCGL